jgi:predicted membrane channel-forming protein YqfA (hemolysin III family)
MKPNKTELPNYTRTQENWNCASHAAGVLFTLIAGPFLLVKAIQSGDVFSIVSSAHLRLVAFVPLYLFGSLPRAQSLQRQKDLAGH